MSKQLLDMFYEYVHMFDIQDEKIALKVSHTIRVANTARQLAEKMMLSKKDCEFAFCIGLLHDIGRFEQVKQYQTFVDADSVDHAQLGIDILLANNKALLRKFISDESLDEIVLQAIYYHNKYEITQFLDHHTLLHCQLIRDADKLDIFYLSTFTSCEILYRCSKEQLQSQIYSDNVFNQIMKQKSVVHSDRKNNIDIYISHMAMVYDLNTGVAKAWLYEKGYMEMIATKFCFTNVKVQQGINMVHKQLQEYLKKHS